MPKTRLLWVSGCGVKDLVTVHQGVMRELNDGAKNMTGMAGGGARKEKESLGHTLVLLSGYWGLEKAASW